MFGLLIASALMMAQAHVHPGYLPYSAQEEDADIRQYCAEEWGAKLPMQVYCRQRAREGADSYERIYARHRNNRELIEAIRNCHGEWTEGYISNFAMIGYCAEQQEKAWRELNR